MGKWGDRGFVDSARDKLSQLSKKPFFLFGFVCCRDLEVWIWGVSVVAAKSKLGCGCFFRKRCSFYGAPLTSVYSFFVKNSES